MNMKPYKRRKFFIEKQFQTKYLLLTILLLALYSLIFVALIFLPYILPLHYNTPLTERAEAAEILLILHNRVWPALLVVIMLLGSLSIFISHKIAGPLYRLKKALQEITEGNLDTRVTLRKGDELRDMAEHINHLAEELRTFVTALKNDYDLLSTYIGELEKQIETRMISEESGREIIEKVNISRKNIHEALDRFKIKR